jgi:hypothetical protein
MDDVKVRIQIGPFVTDRGFAEWYPSRIQYRIGREGQATQLVGDFPNWRLDARYYAANGTPDLDLCPGYPLGKLWLESYITSKDSSINHATADTWYDELIISTADIAESLDDVGPGTLNMKQLVVMRIAYRGPIRFN